MNDFLKKIAGIKRGEVKAARARVSLNELKAICRDLAPTRPFETALSGEGIALIAEVKRASPSAGIIRDRFDPAALARAYEKGGAAAVSVLTEENYFLGDLDHLRLVKKAVRLPVLRKDFIIDEYQIYQSRAAGADAILLIVELLDRERLGDFLAIARSLKLACLVEAHGKKDLEKAIAAEAAIIGVNNRDLKTLLVDLETSFNLLPLIPVGRLRVSESGIKTAADVSRLRAAGAHAVLVGEALLRDRNSAEKIKELTSCM